ncbi:MAG: 4-(cytidine 5'-diphospho)-2-C-methyl-D-erythritol kinase [Eubacteriaceae bacterium]|nr:4-(cytidine 5'-diphospho)-2-C-methyl-D-erythritol kinase [Eubacteriaceae bacterium]
MNELVEKSYAKINLCLHVLGRLPNGYHRISTLMQRVALHDEVTLRAVSSGVFVGTNRAELNREIENNTAKKAAELFFEHTAIKAGVEIFLQKNIPHKAGLGGSSSNGAAVIEGLDKLFETHLSYKDKCALAIRVGADVPFFIRGQTAKVEGIGEKITPIYPALQREVLIIKPPFGVSTKEAYESLRPELFSKNSKVEELYQGYLQNDPVTIQHYTVNTFEKNMAQKAEIAKIKEACIENGAIASLMTGSGSAIFAVFASEKMCYNAYQKMRLQYEQTFFTEFC